MQAHARRALYPEATLTHAMVKSASFLAQRCMKGNGSCLPFIYRALAAERSASFIEGGYRSSRVLSSRKQLSQAFLFSAAPLLYCSQFLSAKQPEALMP